MAHFHRRSKSNASSAVSTTASSIHTNYGYADDPPIATTARSKPPSPKPYLSEENLNVVSTAPVLPMPRELVIPPPPSLLQAVKQPVDEVSDDEQTVSTVPRFKKKNLKRKTEISSSSSESSDSDDVSEVDDDTLLPETKEQKKERLRKEKAEVDRLLKKQKKKISKCVSFCIVPLGALLMLKRVLEGLF